MEGGNVAILGLVLDLQHRDEVASISTEALRLLVSEQGRGTVFT